MYMKQEKYNQSSESLATMFINNLTLNNIYSKVYLKHTVKLKFIITESFLNSEVTSACLDWHFAYCLINVLIKMLYYTMCFFFEGSKSLFFEGQKYTSAKFNSI